MGKALDGKPRSQAEEEDEQADQVYSRESTFKTKVAYEYNDNGGWRVLFMYKGTFWPLVLRRLELYVYPLAHTGLVVYASFWRKDNDDSAASWYGDEAFMVPWVVLSLLTSLMVFFLVFFLGQCYKRFNTFANVCNDINTSVQEATLHCLTHVKNAQARWDTVRYLTAAGMVIYFRVNDMARGSEPTISLHEWERLLTDERDFLELESDDTKWDSLMGWPRTRKEGAEYTARLHAELQLSSQKPPRLSKCPPLLTRAEVDELRRHPGSLMTFVLVAWALQAAKTVGELPPPFMNALAGSCFKMRAAAYAVRQQLSLPVPLPYYHSLHLLMHINFCLYTYALCDFNSNLTPLVLFLIVLITVGMSEVAVALSNPFGTDDVDFPVNKWIVDLRSMALVVHPLNSVAAWPNELARRDAAVELQPALQSPTATVPPMMSAAAAAAHEQVRALQDRAARKSFAEQSTPKTDAATPPRVSTATPADTPASIPTRNMAAAGDAEGADAADDDGGDE